MEWGPLHCGIRDKSSWIGGERWGCGTKGRTGGRGEAGGEKKSDRGFEPLMDDLLGGNH